MEFSVNLCQVPFAGGHAYKITSQTVRYDILNRMYALMGIQVKGNYRFPGSLPVSIERKHIHSVKTPGAYLATEKTDGIRYFLFTVKYDDKSLICMIDRNLDIYHVSMNVYDKLYEGSIFDGELVKTKKGFLFNIFDTAAFLGQNVMPQNFHERFGYAREFMKMVFPAKEDPFLFSTKGFFFLQDFTSLVEFSKAQDYKTDGYVFYPIESPYVPFRHWQLFKWKPLHKNTVDFLLTPTNVQREFSFSVFETKDQRHVEIQKITLPPSLIQVEISYQLLKTPEAVCECKWNEETRTWVPQLVRTDKNHANDLFTFQKTVLNIQENIRLEEFMSSWMHEHDRLR